MKAREVPWRHCTLQCYKNMQLQGFLSHMYIYKLQAISCPSHLFMPIWGWVLTSFSGWQKEAFYLRDVVQVLQLVWKVCSMLKGFRVPAIRKFALYYSFYSLSFFIFNFFFLPQHWRRKFLYLYFFPPLILHPLCLKQNGNVEYPVII